jgi:hypothetical protein
MDITQCCLVSVNFDVCVVVSFTFQCSDSSTPELRERQVRAKSEFQLIQIGQSRYTNRKPGKKQKSTKAGHSTLLMVENALSKYFSQPMPRLKESAFDCLFRGCARSKMERVTC